VAVAVNVIDCPLSMVGDVGEGVPPANASPTSTSTAFEDDVYPDTPLSVTTAQ
jgi:hypothetical protein